MQSFIQCNELHIPTYIHTKKSRNKILTMFITNPAVPWIVSVLVTNLQKISTVSVCKMSLFQKHSNIYCANFVANFNFMA